MSAFLAPLDRIVEWFIIALMALIVVTISADVVARYAMGGSLVFANEVSRMAFIWICFLGMPIGISKGLHVAITSVEGRLSPAAQRIAFRLGLVLVMVLMVVAAIGAVISIGARSAEQLNTIPVSAAWFFYPVAFGSVHAVLHLISQFITGERVVRETIETV